MSIKGTTRGKFKLLTADDLLGPKYGTFGIEFKRDSTSKHIHCVAFEAKFTTRYSNDIQETKSTVDRILQVYPSRAAFRRDHPNVILFKPGESCWDEKVFHKLKQHNAI